eukprot:scaffold64773_cov25-Tisochrysis_lutea.AAC.5
MAAASSAASLACAPVRYQLIVEYVGSGFRGSQRQPSRPTVQETLEQALAHLVPAGAPLPSLCFAGRTDAGVHALGNVAHVELAPMPTTKLVAALNFFLPERLGVVGARRVPATFDARRSAVEREYVYLLRCEAADSPVEQMQHEHDGVEPLTLREQCCESLLKRGWASGHEAHRVVYIAAPLNLKDMRRAAAHFVGVHDFSAFRSKKCTAKSPIRRVIMVDVSEEPDSALDLQHIDCSRRISIRVRGNSFLQHQVRYMVAALLHVGQGKMKPDDMEQLLRASDSRFTPHPAPAHGLYLMEVKYPPEALSFHHDVPTRAMTAEGETGKEGEGTED